MGRAYTLSEYIPKGEPIGAALIKMGSTSSGKFHVVINGKPVQLTTANFLGIYMPLHELFTFSIHRKLYAQAAKAAKGSVADLGCGTGKFIGYLRGIDSYTGIDINPAALSLAEARVQAAGFLAEVRQGNICDESQIPGSYDTIISLLAAYLAGPSLLDCISQKVKPKGNIVIASVTPSFSVNSLEGIVEPEAEQMVAQGQVARQEWENYKSCNYFIASSGVKVHAWTCQEIGAELVRRKFEVVENTLMWGGNLFYVEAKKMP